MRPFTTASLHKHEFHQTTVKFKEKIIYRINFPVGGQFTYGDSLFGDSFNNTVQQGVQVYQLKPFSGEAVAESLYTTDDRNRLYKMDLIRGTGHVDMYRITLSNNRVSVSAHSEYEFVLADQEAKNFTSSHELIEWTDISDFSSLNVLDTMY